MQSNTAKRFSIIIGVLMVVAMGSSVILPLLGRNVAATTTNDPVEEAVQPTAIPFPDPPADLSTIQFDQNYLHPSGLFTVAQPTGYNVGQTSNNGVQAQVNLINQTAESVIEAYVEVPSSAITTLDELSDHFEPSQLRFSWRNYTTAREMSRSEVDDRLLIDFELMLGQRQYLGRHAAWTDGEWIYVVRVVTPNNATDMLRYLLDHTIETIVPNKQFAASPTGWNAYFDVADKHIIRYPELWTVEDSAPGFPASISSEDEGVVLRIESDDLALADEDAARTWIESARRGATVLSVEPVERDDSQGYSVAYSYTGVDGESQSGLALLLNGPDEKLHVANLRFFGQDVDLNNPEDREAFGDFVSMMDTFSVLPSWDVNFGVQ